MAKPKKSKWVKKTLKLKPGHGWSSKPGYNIFAADRGAVRFDFPETWLIRPGDKGSIKFHDCPPPDDNCTLEMSIFYLPEIDWSGLPLSLLVDEVTKNDKRGVISQGEIVTFRRPRAEVAWREVRFIDPNEHREAHSRIAVARWSNIQPLLTFDFWADDAPKLEPVWDEVMNSLVLGDYVEDPTRRLPLDPEPPFGTS